MLASRRFGPTTALALALIVAGPAVRPARAYHKKQYVQVVAAPAAAPVYASAPAAYYQVSSAPAAAPTYVIQGTAASAAPVASAPTATYVIQGTTVSAAPAASTVASAPGNVFFGAAPATVAAAPGSGSTLLGGAFRSALIQDLKKVYGEQGNDTKRSERVATLREEGASAYASYLGSEDDELTTEQKRDLDTIINDIVATDINQGTTGGYYPAPPSAVAAPTYAPVQYLYAPAAPAPTVVPLVPVYPVYHHKHCLRY